MSGKELAMGIILVLAIIGGVVTLASLAMFYDHEATMYKLQHPQEKDTP